MNKHTPGPWHYNDHRVTIADKDGSTSFPLLNPADARLIAAAPDLLAALEELVLRCDGAEGVRSDGSNIQTMRAHAVLARAKGEA